jgi:flagellar protein FliS
MLTPKNAFLNRYLEAEVLAADPVKLVALLYRGALDAISAARAALAAGNIPERSRQIQRAWAIIEELRGSLRAEHSPELSKKLTELYVYAGQRLMDANAEQSERPLIEAAAVLTTLAEAWQGIQTKPAQQQSAPIPADHRPLTIAC